MNYKHLFSLKNKVAVVTGGSGLVGREIVKVLSDFGAKVYIAEIDKTKAKSMVKSTRIKSVYMDITQESSVKDAFATIKQDSNKIDILVNCAYPRTEDWGVEFEHISLESWNKNVDYQLGGLFLCCQIVAEWMKEQKGGSIINFGSIYGVVAPDFGIYKGIKMTMPGVYSAVKGGTVTLTKYLATYYAKYNVRVNVISPGGVFNNQDPSFVKRYSQKTPLGRMANPENIIGAVVYLASDASSYVTGCNLLVDGGWTAW